MPDEYGELDIRARISVDASDVQRAREEIQQQADPAMADVQRERPEARMDHDRLEEEALDRARADVGDQRGGRLATDQNRAEREEQKRRAFESETVGMLRPQSDADELIGSRMDIRETAKLRREMAKGKIPKGFDSAERAFGYLEERESEAPRLAARGAVLAQQLGVPMTPEEEKEDRVARKHAEQFVEFFQRGAGAVGGQLGIPGLGSLGLGRLGMMGVGVGMASLAAREARLVMTDIYQREKSMITTAMPMVGYGAMGDIADMENAAPGQGQVLAGALGQQIRAMYRPQAGIFDPNLGVMPEESIQMAAEIQRRTGAGNEEAIRTGQAARMLEMLGVNEGLAGQLTTHAMLGGGALGSYTSGIDAEDQAYRLRQWAEVARPGEMANVPRNMDVSLRQMMGTADLMSGLQARETSSTDIDRIGALQTGFSGNQWSEANAGRMLGTFASGVASSQDPRLRGYLARIFANRGGLAGDFSHAAFAEWREDVLEGGNMEEIISDIESRVGTDPRQVAYALTQLGLASSTHEARALIKGIRGGSDIDALDDPIAGEGLRIAGGIFTGSQAGAARAFDVAQKASEIPETLGKLEVAGGLLGRARTGLRQAGPALRAGLFGGPLSFLAGDPLAGGGDAADSPVEIETQNATPKTARVIFRVEGPPADNPRMASQ